MKGIAYDAEETDMKKVVILVVGNTLSFMKEMWYEVRAGQGTFLSRENMSPTNWPAFNCVTS